MSAADNKRLQNNLLKLQKAHGNLIKTLTRDRDDVYYEILASRFRLCFELNWRLARRVMLRHGVNFELNTMRELLELAQQTGFFPNSPHWIAMMADRNVLTHEYDEPDFVRICKHIEFDYIPLLTESKEKLETIILKLTN